MGTPKQGFFGRVELVGGQSLGTTNWSMSGGGRTPLAIDEQRDDGKMYYLPGQLEGGDITLSGFCMIHDDAGQQMLHDYKVSGDPITDIKLYIDKVSGTYYTPSAGDYVTVSTADTITSDKAGIASYTATLKVSGVLVPVYTASVDARAIGIHNLLATAVNFVGELLSMGGETPIKCYFEYGETIAYGTDTIATCDDLTEVGLFEAESGLLVTATTYHWRIKVTWNAGANVYLGPDQTFTTP